MFSNTQPDLRGGVNIQAGRQIDWRAFLDVPGEPPFDCAVRNCSRMIDTLISSSLFQLPIPGAAVSGSNVLAFRNLIRADRYGLPSGEAVATELGILPLTPAERGDLGPGSPERHAALVLRPARGPVA